MTVFVTFEAEGGGRVTVRARPESPDDGAVGDLVRDLRAGDTLFGRTYDQWRALGVGAHEMKGGGRGG